MGGKYSIIAKRLNDEPWEYNWHGDSLIMFIAKSIYALSKYKIVDLRKRKV